MQAFFFHIKSAQLGRWWHFSISFSCLVNPGQWHANSSHIIDFNPNIWPFLRQTFSLIWWNTGGLASQSFLVCIIATNKCAVRPFFLSVRYVVSSAQVYWEHASFKMNCSLNCRSILFHLLKKMCRLFYRGVQTLGSLCGILLSEVEIALFCCML